MGNLTKDIPKSMQIISNFLNSMYRLEIMSLEHAVANLYTQERAINFILRVHRVHR